MSSINGMAGVAKYVTSEALICLCERSQTSSFACPSQLSGPQRLTDVESNWQSSFYTMSLIIQVASNMVRCNESGVLDEFKSVQDTKCKLRALWLH